MKIEKYDYTKNPEFADQVIDLLLAESEEIAATGVDRNHVRKLLQGKVVCLVATESGKLLGAAIAATGAAWFNPSVVCMRDLLLWIAPEHRGGTVFQRLLHALEDEARIQRVNKLYLNQSTGIDVEKTSRLYRKMGFVLTGFLSVKEMNHV